jgi:ketosteroid isomerase-like protein
MSTIPRGPASEVWATVQALNRLWTVEGRPDRLSEYFAAEMVAITPSDRERREGREACVAGWTEFVRTTTIHRWEERNPLVLMLSGDRGAVVAYNFTIAFTLGGRLIEMRGRDLMTFEKRQDRWWLLADHYSPAP